MSNNEKYSRLDVINSQISARQEGFYTVLPAIVRSYNADKQEVSVTFAVSQTTPEGVVIPAVNMSRVPVLFPFGDSFRTGWRLKAGDNVLLLFSMRSLDEWKGSKGATAIAPESRRLHSPADAIAIPGLLPTGTRDKTYKDYPHIADEETYLVFNKDDNGLLIKTNKKLRVEATNDIDLNTDANHTVNVAGNATLSVEGTYTVNCDNVLYNTATFTLTGNMSVGGNVGAVGTMAASSVGIGTPSSISYSLQRHDHDYSFTDSDGDSYSGTTEPANP